MSNLKMNIGDQGVEQERTVQELMYNNVSQHVQISTEEPTVPYHKPTPIMDDVDRTSDTHNMDIGPSAHDITARTRNG